MRPLLFLWILGGCAWLAGCGRSTTAPYPGAPVVVVSIDTLRADHLPAYGYGAVETPHIDRLRQDSILFKNAYTHAPLTLPAHASLFTGRLPPEHGVRDNLGYRLSGDEHPTLARLLKPLGYATGASVSAYVLRRGTGLAHGFDFYDDVATGAHTTESAGTVQRPGHEAASTLISWLDGLGGRPPFLAFLHVYEPHLPYEPPEPFRSRYPSAYDGEIAAADAVVGELMAALQRAGAYGRAVIVLLSDHGEGLGDHGEADHGILLYREALHVPLLVKLPKSERAGSTDTSVVGLIDVLPTIARLVGATLPSSLPGRDLLTPGGDAAHVYSETYYPRIHLGWSELHSLLDARWHVIDGPKPELFDLLADPSERTDLAAARPNITSAMRAALSPQKGDFRQPETASREEAEKLRALGYLAGGPTEARTASTRLNPRDEIPVLDDIKHAFRLAAAGEREAARAALRRLLERNPQLFDVQVKLAETEGLLGRYERAIQAYRAAMRSSPSLAADVALPLARVYLDAGRPQEARAHAGLALAAHPAEAHEVLARAALLENDLVRAEQEAQLAAGDPHVEAGRAVVLAEVHIRRDEPQHALAILERAREILRQNRLPDVPNIEFLRGDALARLTRYSEAESAFEAEIRAFPGNAQAYARLAIVYAVRGRKKSEVDALLERMLRASPRRETALLAAQTLESLGDRTAARAWRDRSARLGPSGRKAPLVTQ